MASHAESHRVLVLVSSSLLSLAALGALGARLGGAPVGRGTLRVVVGGGLALAITAGIGKLLGATVG